MVAVKLSDFNRVIQFKSSTSEGLTERDLLLKEVRAAYSDRIKLKPSNCLMIQIKHKDWQGKFIDFSADEVEDTSIFQSCPGPRWGKGVWMGKGPYGFAPYVGQSTISIWQIPMFSPMSPRWGRWGIPLIGALLFGSEGKNEYPVAYWLKKVNGSKSLAFLYSVHRQERAL